MIFENEIESFLNCLAKTSKFCEITKYFFIRVVTKFLYKRPFLWCFMIEISGKGFMLFEKHGQYKHTIEPLDFNNNNKFNTYVPHGNLGAPPQVA